MTTRATQAPEEESSDSGEERTNIAIPAELHRLLKAKAKAEGRVLRAMVAAKLQELVEPSVAVEAAR